MKYANIGPLDNRPGTLSEDLETLHDELEWQLSRNEQNHADMLDTIRRAYDHALDECWDEFGNVICDDARNLYHIEQLTYALQEFAPPYCVFCESADGYGYFPDWCALEELPKVSCNGFQETGERPKSGEYVFVNDHGNTSLMSIDDGSETEIWSIV